MTTRRPESRASAGAVLEALRRRLASLPPGTRLPAERALSTELGCSRETLRRALLRLEEEGLIWRHVGQGAFAGPRPASEPVRSAILLEQVTPADLMAARLVIEPAVAAAAARTAGPEQVDLMRRLALATREAADWRAYEAADEAFHRAIAAATDSRLLMAILGLLSSVRGRSRWQRRHDVAFRAARERRYSRAQGDLHLALVEAIARGDAGSAEAVMREHLTQIQALMAPSESAD